MPPEQQNNPAAAPEQAPQQAYEQPATAQPNAAPAAATSDTPAPGVSPIAIVGLVLSLFLGPIGLIVSVIAYKKRKNPTDKILSIIGIVIGALQLVVFVLMIAFTFLAASQGNLQTS